MPLTPVQPTVSIGLNPYVGDMAPKTERPEMLDLWSAAARQTSAGALYERLTVPDPDLPDAPAGWDALDHLQGYEEYAGNATGIQTPSELEGWKRRVDSQRLDRDVLRRAGFGGAAAELAMMAVDPTFIASIGVPEFGMARLARSGRAIYAAGRGAAEGGLYEAGMQNMQDTRTSSDILMSVGGGALVGGVFGALTRGVPAAEMREIVEAASEDMNPNVTAQSFGAAAVERPTTLAAESLAPGAKQLSELASKAPLIATDLDVIMSGSSIRARTALQELANIPQMVAKNLEGIATPQSAEVNIGRWQAVVADFSDLFRRNYAAVRGIMNYEQFGTAVANAARRGDAHDIKEVAEVASFWRARIADPLKKAAQESGLLGKVDDVVGAVSYFTRRYNREAIRAGMVEWESTLFRWFSSQSDALDVEIKAAIDDVTRKILGMDVGQANFNVRINAEKAGPLKERTLDIPDELIAPFLDNNPLRIASSYVNEMAPQVELARRFGDFEMKDAVSKIKDEYGILKEKATTSEAKNALVNEEKRTLDALLRVRDRILGRAGRVDPATGEGGRRAVAASRGWRNLVTSSKLGATALTGGIMDATRIIIENGFLPTMRNMARLVASPEFRALSKTQARRVGAAVEVALSRRVMAMYDGAITEGWTQKLANSLYKYTGLNHMMDFNRTLACTLLEDRILKVAGQVAEGGRPKKFELARLASLGLDEDALRGIADEVSKHGGDSGGMRVSGSSDWGNKFLADAYDNALLKESKIVVVEPGAADRVWWMDKELGKFIGQLKTFTLSAPARLTGGLAQRIGTGQYAQAARFLGFMMVGGYLTHATRQLVAGKEPITDPADAAKQAFSETGLAGVIPDLIDPLTRTPLGMRAMEALDLSSSSRRADQNAFAAYGGPSAGSAADLIDIVWNRTANGISARDLHAIRRMLPWQNAWFLRRGINAAEGEIAELMQLDGYDVASAGDRVMRTDPAKPDKQGGSMVAGLPP